MVLLNSSEATVRGKVWRITRAGLFLLFVVVLAALGSVDAAVASPNMGVATHEHKPEPKEQRDSEKLRDRLPKPATLNRRHQARHSDDRRPVPAFLRCQQESAEPQAACLPNSGSDTYHGHLRLRHSPAVLQVVRH
jgi:hypothetical protein